MENDERMETPIVQRVHHVFDVLRVQFEFSAVFQIEVGVGETDVGAVHDDIERRKRGYELFESVELLTSREGSVWDEEREEEKRAMRSML